MTASAARRRSGRRPGDSGTREAILAAARTSFADNGYAGTTIRGVARAAGVDAALVHHYFGDKEALFSAALDLPGRPADLIGGVLASGLDGAGLRLATLYLGLWEHPDVRPRLVALVRAAVTEEHAAAILRGFVGETIVRHVAAHLDGPDRELRATLMGSHLVGAMVLRHIIKVPPIATAPVEDVAALLGPTIQRYLTP